jgi:hypothetical protein
MVTFGFCAIIRDEALLDDSRDACDVKRAVEYHGLQEIIRLPAEP